MAAATEPPLALDAEGVKHAIVAANGAPLPEYEAFDDDFDETLDLFAEVAEACETNGRSSDAVRARARALSLSLVVVDRVARLFSSRAR